MVGNKALYDENDRLRLQIINMGTENAQLKKALEILAGKWGDDQECYRCPARGDCKNGCANRVVTWAMAEVIGGRHDHP